MVKNGAFAVTFTTDYKQAFCYSTALHHHGWEEGTEVGRYIIIMVGRFIIMVGRYSTTSWLVDTALHHGWEVVIEVGRYIIMVGRYSTTWLGGGH